MELIKGSESLFYIVRNGVQIPVGCLTSNPIEESSEMMETTTRDNEGWRTSVPTMQSYSIALDGYMTMDDPNSGKNIVSYRELRKIKRNKELIIWKIKTLNGLYVDSGKAYIDTISFTDQVDDFIGFSANLVGYGIPNDINAEYDIYSDAITYNFTYSHEPVDSTDAGNWFLSNLLFNNYYNAFGIVLDCDLKVKITAVPIKGFLANNLTREIYTIDSIISYCEKDNLVYYPNGFNNDLGVVGNYSETFSFKIVDQDGRIGRLTTHTLLMTDSAAPEIDLSASISWFDDTSTPKSGNLPNIIVKVVSIIFDPLDPIVTQEWQTFDGTDWVFYKTKTTDSETFALPILENKIRLKVVSSFGEIAYSNNLVYTKSSTSSIFITDIVGGLTGYTTYKLHVEVEVFNGYVVLQGEKNLNGKNANLLDTLGGSLIIPNTKAIGEFVISAEAITIPVGVYDCVFEANAIPKNSGVTLEVNGLVGYGYTTDIYDSIASAQVNLLIEP